MEASLSSGPKIKRTCDGCTASKVKCSGTLPCTRCSSRGIDCFYRARKKREAKTTKGSNGDVEHVKKTKDISDEKSTTSTTTSAISNHHDSQAHVLDDLSTNSSILLPHEKRSWIVFFSLYKNYNAACARFWFERQLARIKLRLERAQQFHMLAMLKEWSLRMDVDYERVNDRGERCIKAMANPNFKGHALHDCGGIHLHVDGKLASCQGNAQRIFSLNDPARLRMDDVFKASPSTPTLNLKSSGTYPEDVAVITVNPAFEYLFGISQSEINTRTRVLGSGLLPWGGDLLCMLADSEADVFAFMQICAINLNWSFLGRRPEEFPLVREVPSAQVIPVRTPHSEKGIPCLMKCVHRDLVDLKTGITMEVEMSFEPLVPLTQLPSASSPPADLAASSSAMFEQCGLPLADASEGTAPSPDQVLEDDPFPPEAFFPDVGLMSEDETFLDELLTFARSD